MPFVVIVGIPSSGKTFVAGKLKEFFESKGKIVRIVCENDTLSKKNLTRNSAYVNSNVEKEIRSMLKSEVLQKLEADAVLILDGLNYIKGFRYELYCASKTSKTTSCTVHCDLGSAKAWELNLKKSVEEQYSREVFDGLLLRYEEPNSCNRWDSPMVTITDSALVPFQDIEGALYERKPPPPNQSTQIPPLTDTNFLYEVDKIVQGIVTEVLAAVRLGANGKVAVTGSEAKVEISSDRNCSMAQLMRIKRQFITYVKSHSDLSIQSIPNSFVQYLNTNTI